MDIGVATHKTMVGRRDHDDDSDSESAQAMVQNGGHNGGQSIIKSTEYTITYEGGDHV